jgi:hypothetical protein
LLISKILENRKMNSEIQNKKNVIKQKDNLTQKKPESDIKKYEEIEEENLLEKLFGFKEFETTKVCKMTCFYNL